MEQVEINNHKALSLRILQLKSDKLRQEIELKESFHNLVESFNPVTVVKETFLGLSKDKEVKTGFAKIALNMGFNFLIDKALGKNKDVKGYLSSVLVENISGSFINNNTPKILSFFGKLLNKDIKQEN
jgi:hypothetical protein